MLWTQTRADTDMQKKRPNMPPGWNFTKTQKPTLLRCSSEEERERCGCKWGDEVGMNDIPFTISLGGAHCGAGNREAGCKLFKLPVYRAFLPDTPPPHPCLTYWITKFIEMLFSKETWSKHEILVYNFHRPRSTDKIDHPLQISIFFGHNSSFNFYFGKITHCIYFLSLQSKYFKAHPPLSAPLPPVSINHSVHIPLHCWPIPPRNGW